MKKYKTLPYLFYSSIFMLVALLSSCEPDSEFEDFRDTGSGAYPRTISVSGSFIASDIPNSIVDIEVEFYDANQGKDVTAYNWTVRYLPGGSIPPGSRDEPYINIPASEFTLNSDGRPGVQFAFELEQAMEILGIDAADVNPDDVFRFEAELKTSDGRTFDLNNVNPDIIIQFQGLFNMDVTVQ